MRQLCGGYLLNDDRRIHFLELHCLYSGLLLCFIRFKLVHSLYSGLFLYGGSDQL